jgi:GTP1/Obg family GTP-binding protein
MENDKFQNAVLEHLAHLTQEITEMKIDISQVKTDIDQVKTAVVRIENEQGEKIRALFDAREAQNDVNGRIFETMSRIEDKLDGLTLQVSSHDALLKKAK